MLYWIVVFGQIGFLKVNSNRHNQVDSENVERKQLEIKDWDGLVLVLKNHSDLFSALELLCLQNYCLEGTVQWYER